VQLASFEHPPYLSQQTITELEDAVGALRQLHSKKRVPSSSKLKSEKEKEKPKDVSKEGMFGIFKKSMPLFHIIPQLGLTLFTSKITALDIPRQKRPSLWMNSRRLPIPELLPIPTITYNR
jgi:hypothetical protein